MKQSLETKEERKGIQSKQLMGMRQRGAHGDVFIDSLIQQILMACL